MSETTVSSLEHAATNVIAANDTQTCRKVMGAHHIAKNQKQQLEKCEFKLRARVDERLTSLNQLVLRLHERATLSLLWTKRAV